jgi:hypothetical protein
VCTWIRGVGGAQELCEGCLEETLEKTGLVEAEEGEDSKR